MLALAHPPLSHNPALSILAAQLGELAPDLQEELAYAGVLTIHVDREVEVWLGVDMGTRPSSSRTSFKVLVALEPPDVKPLKFDPEAFDLVLTWQIEEHLQRLTSARLFVPATPWVLPAEWESLRSSKHSGLGFLRGAKNKTVGHKLRHEVWDSREELSSKLQIPLDFIEGGSVPRVERNRQFCNHFVLVIENSRHGNYFTEKLLDALLCGCVPVYWGCPNLADYFDIAGVVQVEGGVSEVVAACSSLTEADYDSRKDAISRNFEAARAYAGDFGQRLQRAIAARLAEAPGDE